MPIERLAKIIVGAPHSEIISNTANVIGKDPDLFIRDCIYDECFMYWDMIKDRFVLMAAQMNTGASVAYYVHPLRFYKSSSWALKAADRYNQSDHIIRPGVMDTHPRRRTQLGIQAFYSVHNTLGQCIALK